MMTKTSSSEGPFCEHVRSLLEFLTRRCKMSEACAHECLKAFLLQMTASPQLTENIPQEISTFGDHHKHALRGFAREWRPQLQGERGTESRDALGFPATIWT